MSVPLLSVVIPTYNRESALAMLLEDINVVLQNHHLKVQIVICNNASTDGTPALIESYRLRWGNSLKVITRKVNIGMEGNIACSILDADGKYIWMLSDHQRLCVPEVINVIHRMTQLEFDVGHAKLVQWSAVLPNNTEVVTWANLSLRQRGALLFSITNLSTLIFKRSISEKAIKSIFNSCIWGFPHLGIISQINELTRLIEFNNMSKLPNANKGGKLVYDYDVIFTRYYYSSVCVGSLAKKTGINFSYNGFYSAEYRASFVGDVLNYLVQPEVNRRQAINALLPIALINPLGLKVIALFVLFSILAVPKNIRINIAERVRHLIIKWRLRG